MAKAAKLKSARAVPAKDVEALERIAVKPADTPQGGALRLVEDDTGHRVLIYSTDKGMHVDLRHEGDTFWATQAQMAELFGVTRANVTIHLKNVFEQGELDEASTCKDSLRVGVTGQEYATKLYNLNAIISVGYRVGSKQGTMFRIWATEKLFQILTKGFYIDKERLKNPDQPSVLDELKQQIREIRASTQNVYREVKAICALCADYDTNDPERMNAFFAKMENKLLWVATGKTGPEIIKERADLTKPDMGLTYHTGKRGGPTQKDVETANNYLYAPEGTTKNRGTTMLLDYFEDQVDQGRLVTMAQCESAADDFIRFNKWPLLTHKGSVKGDDARAHARALLKQYYAHRKLNEQ